MSIRDFVYLDIERVRSFYAQLSKGLPTERTVERSKEAGLDTSVEGNVLFAKGQANADYRYVRSNSETSSLHDYIMEEFLEKLQQAKLLMELPNSELNWQQSAFADGGFVLVKGNIKIIDYKYIASNLENVPKMAKLLTQIVASSHTQQSSNMSDLEKSLKNVPLSTLSKFIEQNMQDPLRVKIYPYKDLLDQYFLAPANESFFRYNTLSLINMYGHVIDANWSCLLQINRGNQHHVPKTAPSVQPNDGTVLEKLMEYMADTLTGINRAMQGITFPAIAATPIAIFRDIS